MASELTLSPFELVQQNTARTLNTMLDAGKQVEARQTAVALASMHGVMGSVHPGFIAAMRELLDVQATFASSLGTQWKNTLDYWLERGGTCISDLRRAENRDEVMGVLGTWSSELNQHLHADAENVGKVVLGATEASRVVVSRGLDSVASSQLIANQTSQA